MSFDKWSQVFNFFKKIEKNHKFLFAMSISAIFTIIFTISPSLWHQVFTDPPQYEIIILIFCIIFAALYPFICMVCNFYCWAREKIRAKNLQEKARKEIVTDLLGLGGLRYDEFQEHKYPYPDSMIDGLAWKIRLKRYGAALGQPFCINCKMPIYDYSSSAYNKKPIQVTIACRKCKKSYQIDDLEETIKNHNFDILHDPNYLYKLINTDQV